MPTKSMKMCCFGKPKFLNELFQKLKNRRGDDDDGLPSSPVRQSTQDVLDDIKKSNTKSHDSKHSIDSSSMYSSEDELEDKNTFNQDWGDAAGTSQKDIGPITDSNEALDLNAVSSTVSLASNFAQHKISIKPKNVRPSKQHRRVNKSAKPKHLPQVEEKEEAKSEDKASLKLDSEVEAAEDDESEDKAEADESKVEITVTADVEPPSEHKRQSTDSSRDADDEDDVVEPEAGSEEDETKPVTIIIPKLDTKPTLKSPLVSPQKSPKKSFETKQVKPLEPENVTEEKEVEPVEKEKAKEKVHLKAVEDTESSKPFNVVLRKTGRRTAIEESGTIRDPSKRQTIAGDSGLTSLFGERKAGNRNSFAESSRSPEPKDEPGSNEFSQVFNRLKKQPSRKKLIPNEDKPVKATDSGNVEQKKLQTSKENSIVVEPKSKLPETKPVVSDSKPKVTGSITPKKPNEQKPKVPEGKPKIAENKPRISENKPKLEPKIKISENSLKKPEAKPISPKVSVPKSPDTKSLGPKLSDPKSDDRKLKTTIFSKTPSVSKPKTQDLPKDKDVPKAKEKEVVIIKKSEPLNLRRSESKSESTVTAPLDPISETKSGGKSTGSIPPASEQSKPLSKVKPKQVDHTKQAVIVDKIEPKKNSLKDEAKVTDKGSFKRDSPLVKNRMRSVTLTEPAVQGTNKENEVHSSIQRSHSQGDTVEAKAVTKTPVPVVVDKSTSRVSDTPPTQTSGPDWITLANKKRANWQQKEKDQEQKDKKETSNIAVKERDSKGKEVTLTITEAAKEATLRPTGKCANSTAHRKSVHDMTKLFSQVK